MAALTRLAISLLSANAEKLNELNTKLGPDANGDNIVALARGPIAITINVFPSFFKSSAYCNELSTSDGSLKQKNFGLVSSSDLIIL